MTDQGKDHRDTVNKEAITKKTCLLNCLLL